MRRVQYPYFMTYPYSCLLLYSTRTSYFPPIYVVYRRRMDTYIRRRACRALFRYVDVYRLGIHNSS